MTLVVSVYTGEGIVMASDSRMTYNDTARTESAVTERIGVHFTDTMYKTFLLRNGSGLSTNGSASVDGRSITGLIDRFNIERIRPDTRVSEVPGKLLDFFGKGSMDTTFHVAGYEGNAQKVFVIDLMRGVTEHDTRYSGAVWSGESDTMLRILSDVTVRTPNGDLVRGPPEILWNLFTAQDAVDFARYAIETTANTMRFTKSSKTVGGPIDVLLIKPGGPEWISRKKLA